MRRFGAVALVSAVAVARSAAKACGFRVRGQTVGALERGGNR